MKITRLDRSAMTLLRVALDKAVKEVGDELGVSIKVGSGSFDPFAGTGKFKLEIASATEQGDIVSPEAKLLDQFAASLGLPADVRGKSVMLGGKPYTIEGYQPRSQKYPILARNANGKLYKHPLPSVQRALGVTVMPTFFPSTRRYEETPPDCL